MRHVFWYLILFILFFSFLSNKALAYTFNQSLRYGSQGPDVQELQKILNSDSETRVTSRGVGGPGQESIYFGLLTHNAVIKFQNKYASEILSPGGLRQGNGFVGPFTLKKLNSLSKIMPQISPSQSEESQIKPYIIGESEKIDIYTTDNKVKALQDELSKRINNGILNKTQPQLSDIMKMSQFSLGQVFISQSIQTILKPGSNISFSGIGFEPINKVYFGNSYVVRDAAAVAGGVSFNIPAIPDGKYDIAIKNNYGISNTATIVIASSTQNLIRIDSITSTKIRFGESITVNGVGFTPQSNDIVTSMGTIKAVSSSNGRTLSFVFAPESMKEISRAGAGKKSLPIEFYIVSEYGYSQPFVFLLLY